jgi:hypothetical protein
MFLFVVFAARSEVELKGVQVEQSEASSVSFSLDDDPEGLEDSTWSYDTNIKDLDDFVGQVPGSRQADKEIRLVISHETTYSIHFSGNYVTTTLFSTQDHLKWNGF